MRWHVFILRVFYSNAKRYRSQNLNHCYELNEKEKKKQYNERVLQIEQGSFTPLVMSANSGMGRECRKFFSRLSEKRKLRQSIIASCFRRKISFLLMKSILSCIRGSRSIFDTPKIEDSIMRDAEVSEKTSNIILD